MSSLDILIEQCDELIVANDHPDTEWSEHFLSGIYAVRGLIVNEKNKMSKDGECDKKLEQLEHTLSMTYYLINHSEQTTLGDIIIKQIPESMDFIKTLKNQ